MLAILAFVLTLLLVVGLHEAGHALAARFFGVTIESISIGFGKPLLRWRDKSGCEWIWALWPLGGYVRLLNTRIHPVDPADYPRCFDKQTVLARCVILLAGVVTNLLVAWLAFLFFFMLGYQHMQPVIKTTIPGRLLTQVDIRNGDRFIAIDGKSTGSWQAVGMNLIKALGRKDVDATLMGVDGKTRNVMFDLSPHFSAKGCKLFVCMGIEPDHSETWLQTVPGSSFMLALKQANTQLTTSVTFFGVMLKQLFTGKLPFALLLGPWGFLTLSINSFVQGLSVFLSFIATLSLTVGLVNIVPVPGLDGASVLYTLIEKIRGKPMSVAFELLLYRLAIILFYVILIQLMLNDLLRHLAR